MIKVWAYMLMFFGLVAGFGCRHSLDSPQTHLQTGDGKEYLHSYQQWKADKLAWNDSYQYTIRHISWTENGADTRITVRNGKVASRTYEVWRYEYRDEEQPPQKVITQSWTETGPDLNSHPEGAPAITLDVLYEKCGNDWLTADRSSNTLFFEHGNNGILSVCGYVPKNCADDCFVGVHIANFEWLD
jgi:hypothetical protein